MTVAGPLLRSRLLGNRPGRTRLGVGALVTAVVAVVLAGFLPRTVLAARSGGVVVWLFNGYVAGVLFLTMAAATVLGVAYAIWNGGPVLSFVFPLCPVATGTLLAGGTAVTTDLTVALCGGAAGAVVATERLWTGTSDGNRETALTAGLALSVAACILGAGSLWDLFQQTGRGHPGVVIAGPLLVVALAGVVFLLLRAFVPALVPERPWLAS